jgi:hypothetical protein
MLMQIMGSLISSRKNHAELARHLKMKMVLGMNWI